MRLILSVVIVIASLSGSARAQQKADPLADYPRFMFGVLKEILVGSAEKMPEEHYAFRPTEAVRTYGQIVGHVADYQYLYCSALLGEKPPAVKIEKTVTSKPALVDALKAALAYCDRAYATITPANAQDVLQFGHATPRVHMITNNLVHATEHYGNLVTYMRMKNVVPPTSEPGFMTRPRTR